MELDATKIIVFLLGSLQAIFFWNRHKDLEEIKELKQSIKETNAAITNMERMLSNMEKQIAVANYALFQERRGDNHEQ